MTRRRRLWLVRRRRVELARLLRRAETMFVIENIEATLRHYDGWAVEWLL
jgi:hypothetical protein